MSDTVPLPHAPAPDRQRRLSELARADAGRLKQLWDRFTANHSMPEHVVLRAPEIGTIMVQGRAGAVGAPFNLGEMTVTRTSVRLQSGQVGHGYVQGRDGGTAKIAALVDALAQTDAAAQLDREIVAPLQHDRCAKTARRAAKAAATKVEFFTMVRGDN